MFDFFKSKAEHDSSIISEAQFIQKCIEDFEVSTQRADMLTGERYYENNNDINTRVITSYEGENKIADETKANNKLAHSFMKLLVDEKVGYFVGQAPVFTSKTDNEQLIEKIKLILDDEFDDVLNDLTVEASNKGIAWLQIYIDEEGNLKFINIPSEQIIPLWGDISHKKLEGLIRYYYVETYIGLDKKEIRKVEYWTNEGVKYYIDEGGSLIDDIEVGSESGHFVTAEGQMSWGKIPFIDFKNNSKEINDLRFVKSLIDDYDKNTSDFSNSIEEVQQEVLVLKNYGGTDVAEFRRDLKYNRVIKIDDEGGAEALTNTIQNAALDSHLDRLKKDFYHFGQGVDMDTSNIGNSPSGVALEFLYSKLKLKVDTMERKYKTSFKNLFYFITEYLNLKGEGAYLPEDIKVTFTRSIISNLKETVETVNASTAVISKKTALAHHPWVEDVEEEMENLEDEKESIDLAALDYGIIDDNTGEDTQVEGTENE